MIYATAQKQNMIIYPAGKKTGECIEERKETCYGSIIRIRPMEIRCDIVLPGKRKNLAVQVIDCSREEEQDTYPPSPIGHYFLHMQMLK